MEIIYLNQNNLSGTFTIAGASTKLTSLELRRNKLKGFVCGKILANLLTLRLSDNEFEGDFILDEENFPKSMKHLYLLRNNLSGTFTATVASTKLRILDLYENKLTGFVGGGILTNLWRLDLRFNKFKGDFIVNEENFPTSIEKLWLGGN